MTESNPLLPDSPISDPVQAILGRLDLLVTGLQELMPLLDLMNKPEGDPIRQLAGLLETLSQTAEALESATLQLPHLLTTTEARLTSLEAESAQRHSEQMQMLQRLLKEFDAAE